MASPEVTIRPLAHDGEPAFVLTIVPEQLRSR